MDLLDLRLDGKTALITGGGGGIGGAVAFAMAELGASIKVVDYDLAKANAVVESIEHVGGSAQAFGADISDVGAIRQLFSNVDASGASLDILVTTAGMINYQSILDQEEDSFDKMLQVNLRGTFFCIQEAARRMVPRGEGSIVTIASTAAFVAGRVAAPAYGMTKAGIRQLTTATAVELAPHGVRVNAVAPATIQTPFVQGGLDTKEQQDRANARVPMGRFGQPNDVVGAIVFLASPLASYITGHTLVVDGGLLGRAGT